MSRSMDVSKKERQQLRVQRYLDEALGLDYQLPQAMQRLLANAILARKIHSEMVLLIPDHLVCCDLSTGEELWRAKAHFDVNRPRKLRLRSKQRVLEIRDKHNHIFLQFDLSDCGALVVA